MTWLSVEGENLVSKFLNLKPRPEHWICHSRLILGPDTSSNPYLCRTLGIIAATALAARGIRVAVLERGPLKGRDQEWNISRSELNSLTEVRFRVCA